MRQTIMTMVLALMSSYCAIAQNTNSPTKPTPLPKEVLQLPQSLDHELEQLLQRWYEGYERRSISPYSPVQAVAVPNVADSVYINMLDRIPSAIRLSYNSVVRESIELYLYRRRPLLSLMLSLSDLYFPDIEAELDRHRLPLELKYLTIVESALNPSAISPAGATGLWQFMLPTARLYGLDVNSLVDERMDPIKGTEAACKMLKELYRIYNDWWLVMAAYNCGPGNVNRAIARSGGGSKTFWDIYPYLPRETRKYVPLYIGVYFAMYYANHYGIQARELGRSLATEYYEITETTSFAKLASLTGLSTEQIKAYNPQFRRGIIPWNREAYQVRLPLKAVMKLEGYSPEELRSNELSVQNEEAKGAVAQAKVYATADGKYIYHVVGRRETLDKIAKRYGVTPKEIRTWNSLGRRGLKRGQRIIVGTKPIKGDAPATKPSDAVATNNVELPVATATPATTNPNSASKHTVAKGETLISIAMRYNTSVAKLRELNKLERDAVKPGDVLMVSVSNTPPTTAKIKQTVAQDTIAKEIAPSKSSGKETKAPQAEKKATRSYKVKSGDTLGAIARKHGVSVSELRKRNRLSSDRLQIGQVLRIED